MRYLANCSMLFTEHPLLERPAAARAAGFAAIELWWPFATPVPAEAEADRLVAAITDAGVRLVGLNLFAGDLTGEDRGVLSVPGRTGEFADCLAVAMDIGRRLGVEVFNAVYGNRVPGADPAAQDELATEGLALAASAAATIGATILVEPLSGAPAYPLRTAADALAVIDRAHAAGAANVGLLCDLYHLAVNGDDVDAVIAEHTARIAHVQIADAPGRGEPGSGTLPLDRWLAELERHGYEGWISLEYRP